MIFKVRPYYPRIRNGEDVEADNRWGDKMKKDKSE